MSDAKPNGFVHVIESPSPIDLLDGRTEGRSLSEAFNIASIPHSYSLAVNSRMMRSALEERLTQAIEHFKVPPIVHISAHGNTDGIGLTSGEFLSWRQLNSLLQPLHDFYRGGMLICLSSCESAMGMTMAMTDGPEMPFWALVSHRGKPSWSDCAIAYIAFYNRFFKGHTPEAAVEAMRAATDDHDFQVWFGETVKRDWQQRAQETITSGLNAPVAPKGILAGLGTLGPNPFDQQPLSALGNLTSAFANRS